MAGTTGRTPRCSPIRRHHRRRRDSFAGSVTSTRGVLVDPVLSYDADDAYLTIQGVLFTLNVPANAPTNVQNVANAIDQFIIGGGTPPAGFQNLFNYTPAQLETALTQLEGQPATGAQTSTFQLMTDFMNLLSDPSSGGGGNPTGGGAPGFAPEQEASLPSDIAEAYKSVLRASAPKQQSFDQRWSAWGSAFGGAAKLDGNPVVGSGDVTASDYGFAAGMDYRATPDRFTALRSPAAAPIGAWREISAPGGATASRSACMTPRIGGRCICPARWLSPIIGSRRTASRSATISPQNSTARVTRRAAKPAIATRCRSPVRLSA